KTLIWQHYSKANLVCSCCYHRSPSSLTNASNSSGNTECAAGLCPISRRSFRWENDRSGVIYPLYKLFDTNFELLQRKLPKPLKYPKSVAYIITNEFCERFNYYGLRTILVLYLTSKLQYDNDTSTVLFHIFTMMVYLCPLVGAVVADSWLEIYDESKLILLNN
uniref:Uncharacterized protein n=1 Tax=Glossina brevipalpis TaxID=37001 RepID=A0A1A9WTP4_9MUSC